MAHATLIELLHPQPGLDLHTHVAGDSSDKDDLLHLFDRITSSEQSPVFAAADLNVLPLQLIIDEDDSKSELLREIRQLKRFIQDALNGRVDEPNIQIDCAVQTINEYDIQGQSTGYYSISPKSSFKSSLNASTSSPELPSSTSLFSTSNSSLIPTMLMSPIFPYYRSENHYSTSNCLLGATVASTINNSTNHINDRNGSSMDFANNYSRRKRDGCGNRLDAMIRKLADRQKEREAAAAAIAQAETAEVAATSSTNAVSSASTNSSSSSSSSSCSSNIVMVPREQSPPPATTIWHNQMIDPIAYVNMLRTMTGAMASATTISSPSSIFPSVIKTPHRPKIDSLTEFGDNLEDGSIDVVEKNSNGSSPSPSDSSNNVDETTYPPADLVEKPFTCEHANCHKRFANKFLLKKHQFIHTGLRPHCCPFCGKRFNRKDNLLRHKKTHIANALGTDITGALSSGDFLLQFGTNKAAIKLENGPEEESEN